MKFTPYNVLGLCLLVSMPLFFSCGDEEIIPAGPDIELPIIITTGDENYLNLDSDYIFDHSKLHTLELNLPASELAKIDADPTAEEYVATSLVFEGDTLSPVGVRYKGSIGAFLNCVSGGSWSNPSGRKTCTKLSMKIKINWDGANTKFFGLKKLQLHSLNNDPSQLRERLGYEMYRAMGVPASRVVHSRLIINGDYVGLFALVEQIDGRWAKYNFDDDDGNIYKEAWPLDSEGEVWDESYYLAFLKTNEEDNPSSEIIHSFGSEVATSSNNNLQPIIEKWMDIDETIAHMVVDRMIRADDGPLHWYCNGNSCSNHNYYWYEEPNNQKLHLIPWDLDHAFVNITEPNPVTNIPDEWGTTRNNCEPFSSGFLFVEQRSAACDPIIGAWATYDQLYEQKKEAFKNGPFNDANVTSLLDQWSQQIRAATEEANALHGDAVTISQWESAVEKLKEQVNISRDK